MAEPAVLLRRVYLDLIGLPPPVEDVLAFESAPTPANYERIVRKLMAMPAFGEHWARWWLDLARYAESTGYSGDFLHAMWPYRDWVIPQQAPPELFAFGPRHRLSAEAVRDNVLAVAGLLKTNVGGPPVFPRQPDGMWNEIFQSAQTVYPTSTGSDVFRRSVYIYWRRGSLFPVLATFDAPIRDVSATKRLRSNTPLQALVLMNEPMFIEAAKAFAARIRDRKGDDLEKIKWAFRTSVARAPTSAETNVLASLLETPGGAGAEENA